MIGQKQIDAAREALDSMDDYARMNIGVDPIGPRTALERFISSVEAAMKAEPVAEFSKVSTESLPPDWISLLAANSWELYSRSDK